MHTDQETGRFRALVENARDSTTLVDRQGRVTYQSRRGAALLGLAPEALVGRRFIEFVHPEDLEAASGLIPWTGTLEHLHYDTTRPPVTVRMAGADGEWRYVEATAHSLEDGDEALVAIVARDVSERHRLEEQLRHAQKMEAVGRLAGGIAHDFNNLLTAIQGNVAFAMEEVGEDSPAWEDLEETLRVAHRAGDLTRRLLTFSRSQVVDLQSVDINELLTHLRAMVARLISDDVELVADLSPESWLVRADPLQLEHVILNLAVNAEDAMPAGGILRIETQNVVLDESFARARGVDNVGEHVVIAVSDTGIGMSREVQERAFEPFYTTKDPGKGTGLGLSTVYGIVRQSGGFVHLYSEPGNGTTLRIYLPRFLGARSEHPEIPTVAAPLGNGHETILVVEDEDAARSLVRRMVERAGYRALVASNGREALKVSQRHEGPLHLLLTDVVMPEVGGVELADTLMVIRPEMRVLFMSGYTHNCIVDRGALPPGAFFLDKPFTPQMLAHRIRDALDAPVAF